jgi:hypothetical protein
MPAAQSSASKTPRVILLHDGFTQDVGIALAGPGELDHSAGNDFVGEIAVATCKSKGHAGHFECDPRTRLVSVSASKPLRYGVMGIGALRSVQAGARPVSLPPAPDPVPLPVMQPTLARNCI